MKRTSDQTSPLPWNKNKEWRSRNRCAYGKPMKIALPLAGTPHGFRWIGAYRFFKLRVSATTIGNRSMRSTRALLAFLPEIRRLSHRCKSRSGASPPACRSPWRSSPQGSRCGTPRCSSIRKQLNARRPKSSKGSASVENGGPSGNGKILLCLLLRPPQRLPAAASCRVLVEVAASSRSAAAGDLSPPRTQAVQVAFKWFVSLVI